MEFSRLLETAVEGVGDPALHTDPSQNGKHHILGAPNVQQHREIEIAGNPELRLEKMHLPLPIEIFDIEIQADFSDGDRFGGPGFQRFEIFFYGTLDIHRVDAERGITGEMGGRNFEHFFEIRMLHGRNYEGGNACGPRPLDHIVPVRVEFFRVEVAMGVDQHQWFTLGRFPTITLKSSLFPPLSTWISVDFPGSSSAIWLSSEEESETFPSPSPRTMSPGRIPAA